MRLTQVESMQDAMRAYSEVLDAVGHNHSGWLYDAAGPAAPILVAIVRDFEGWTRWAALEVLIDSLAWVRPEQQFVDADGYRGSVSDALRETVAGLGADLQAMASDLDLGSPVSKSAAHLLQALRESEEP